jgi:nucleoside-diphosphate-sugar epimerase
LDVALVTGATGFVGPYLVAALCARGYKVRILALPHEKISAPAEVEVYRGDVCRQETLVEPMRGADFVFHLAGIHGLWRPRAVYHEVNVSGTENVCNAALAAGVYRLIHVSTWAVYQLGLGQALDEHQPLNPFPDNYTITKAKADKTVQRFIANQGLPAVIVRPGIMFGPGDEVNFARMADRLMKRRAIIIGSGRNPLVFVYVKDVVEGLILAATNHAAVGRIYNMSNDSPLTQEEFWRTIAEAIGTSAPRWHVPYRALYMAARLSESLVNSESTGRQPLITRFGVELFGGENLVSSEKAHRELGYAAHVSIREGLHLAAQWYTKEKARPLTALASEAQGRA